MKFFLFAGAAFAMLAMPAYAQPPQGGPGGMRMPQNRAEIQQMIQDRFAAADADRDGFVSPAELGGPGAGQGGRGGNRFARIDANKDGKLSLGELSGQMLARFDRIDADRDGTISDKEREAFRAAARARREARGGPPMPPPGEDGPQE